MSESRSTTRASDHQKITALIPWYVNETLGEAARGKVEEHMRASAGCREQLALERRIRAGMSAESQVEFMPAASLNKLRGVLDKESADGAQTAPNPVAPGIGHWQWLTAASFAAALAAVGLLMAGHWLTNRGSHPALVYHTVTDSVPHPHDEVVRAVFTPTITLVELQVLLDEAQLPIVSGPTEAGVYSLAPKYKLAISTSLARLRRHRTVRFAESLEPIAEARTQ